MNVSNGKCIRDLSRKSLRANRTRNLIAVLAIALTTVLFTSLFTIAMSINDGIQQNNFRQVGGFSHGGFKYLTEEQFHELKDDPLIDQWGLRRFVGMPSEVPFNKSHVVWATPMPTRPTGCTATRLRGACPRRAPMRPPRTPMCWS